MKNINVTINFDMDGTIADFYGVENWLDCLSRSDTTPYAEAKALAPLATIARQINRLQKQGYKIGVISWASKTTTTEFLRQTITAKKEWLKRHLPSVNFDLIAIIPYGTPKEHYCFTENDILFDDEEHNRSQWTGKAYDQTQILEVLKELLNK